MKLLSLFIILNVLNVIIQTIKSIATVKCEKTVAAVINAIAYGLYTVVLVYMNCDLNLWAKVLVVGGANLIGVYVVKYCEERSRKEKLWKVEACVSKENDWESVILFLKSNNIPVNYIDIGKCVIINVFCANKGQSHATREILKTVNAKWFVTESKNL